MVEACETIHKLFATILDGAPTRVSIIDGGRLSPIVARGTAWTSSELVGPSGRQVASLPLLSKGRLVGLVDVIAATELVEDSRAVLEAAATQGAALLESVAKSSALLREDTSLQLSSERLDEGIALTAHEMKSPVVAAMAAIDYVIGSGDLDDRRRHLLATSRKELGKLSELIHSLLSSARDSADDDLVETNLSALVQEAAESCSWERREDRVTVDAPVEVSVRGEVPQLRSAMKSMISIALLHTPADGKVSVQVRDDDGLATVSVRDHGPAASAEDLSAIFEPVLRSQKMGSRAGTTLGLMVTQRVADALGGRVWAESRPDGAAIHFQVPSLSA